MDKRGLNLVFTFVIVFAGVMFLQSYLFPKKQEPEADKVAETLNDQDSKDDKKASDKKDTDQDSKSKSDDKDDQTTGESKQDGDSTKDDSGKDDKKTENDKSDEKKSDNDQDKKTEDKNKTENDVKPADVKPEIPAGFVDGQLVSIGSLDPTAASRLLATINRRGATIRRVTLSSWTKKGKLRYRDVGAMPGYPAHPGYMGNLELTAAKEGGCKVNVVGLGTPAAVAGTGTGSLIQVNDILLSVNGEPVTTPADFDEVIAYTKPDTFVDVELKRGGVTQTVSVLLMEKPLETIRPEPYLKYIDEEEGILMPRSPESLLLTLRVPSGSEWKEVAPELRTGIWDIEPGQGDHSVTLSKKIDLSKSSVPDLKGTVTVYKKFSISQGEANYQSNQFDRHYHVNVEFKFSYEGDGKPELAFDLHGPTGTPIDGWWFQNKIHGESLALFKTAGARDIVGQSKGVGFNFIGGPKIITDAANDKPPVYVFDPKDPRNGVMQYLAVDCQYFAAALLPDERYENDKGVREFECFSAYAVPCVSNYPENKRLRRTVDMSFRMFSKPMVMENGKSHEYGFELFTGPKEHKLLRQYELEDLRSFGWFAFVSRPLTWLLRLFYSFFAFFGLGSYGLAIILLTVLVRSAMIPISRKAALNAQMMQKLAPQMKDIAEKYKEDMEGRLKAQRELFSRHKYNPYGGCMLMFLQLPIFIGLYRGLSVDMALRDQPLIHGIRWCSDLAGPDKLLYWESWMPQMLAGETGWLGPYLNILPLITVVLFLVQQKMFTPPPTDDQQKMMQKMMTFMMLFMGVLFFKVSSGLCLYFITSSLWGIIERKLLPKPTLKFDDDKSGAVVDGKVKPSSGPVKLRESDDDRRKRERDRKAREKRKRDRDRQ